MFEPLYAAMAQLDRPIWLHPARTAAMPDYAAEQKSRFEMWWCFGWPYDTSVAMVRLAFCGLFDRYPNLKIITHHLGGMIPFYDGRIGPGLDVLGQRTIGRGLFKNPAVAEAAASRLYARFLRRHRDVRRRRRTHCAAGSTSSAPTRWCSPPTPRSARSSRRSTR